MSGGLELFPIIDLVLGGKDDCIELLKKYYHSDFRLANLVSWGGGGSIYYARHGDNIVLFFKSYTDDSSFFSIAGNKDVYQTLDVVCELSVRELGRVDVRLLPQEVADQLEGSYGVQLRSDRDQRDYIMSIDNISNIKGRSHAHTRELVNRFLRESGKAADFIQHVKLADVDYRQLREVFLGRESAKGGHDYDKELAALTRLIQYSPCFDVECTLVYVAGELEAFLMYELIDSENVLAHFWRANTSYRGLYQAMLHRLCIELTSRGYRYMNFMQDLGIEGLRNAKEYLRPIAYREKYQLTNWKPAQKPVPHIFHSIPAPQSLPVAHPY